MKHHLLARPLAVFCFLAGLALGLQSQAASVSLYGVGKAQNYVQTSDTSVALATGDGYAFRAFAVSTSADSSVALLQPPGALFPQDPLTLTGDILSFDQSFASQAALDSAFGAGKYLLEFIGAAGFDTPSLTLNAGTFPVAPQITNFTNAQAIDGTKDFVLNWNSFAGAGPNDFVEITVTDPSGTVLFDSGLPGQSGALASTAKAATIPANTLAAGAYNATLTFSTVASRDTTSLSGALGITTYSATTTLTLKTGGTSSGGGTDTVPPVLLSVSPANGSFSVPTNSPVKFTFSEPMGSGQSITWSFPNVVPSQFNCVWSSDNLTLTCTYAGGFAPSTAIAWNLDTSVFQDTAGNPLSSANDSGAFVTGSASTGGGGTTNNPCSGVSTNDTSGGSLGILKSVQYLQTSSAAPVLGTDSPAIFTASLSSPETNPVTRATVTLPGGSVRALTNLFGRSWVMFEAFATPEALDAAYPAGIYKVNIVRQVGTAEASITVGTSSTTPTPQITNLATVQKFDPAADLTVQWLPFTGAAGNDSIYFEIHDLAGAHFSAPDPCVPRTLANTAVSVLVPKGTFTSNAGVQGSLIFSKFTQFDSNSIPGIIFYSGGSKDTEFQPQSSGTGSIVLQNFLRLPSGTVQFQVSAQTGTALTVQGSSDLVTWTSVKTGVAVSGTLDVVDAQAVNQNKRYYRATSP